MKILIAEDDFITRKILSNFLITYGEIDTAENGREALHLFTQKIKKEGGYDLICLDIIMPKLNGHETLEAIRRIEREQPPLNKRPTKVIMTTALDDSQSILKSFNSQCDGYITKPYSWEKLKAEVDRVLQLDTK